MAPPPTEGGAERYRLGLLGDVMLGRNVDRRRRGDPPPAVWGSAHEWLTALDGCFANLECCLSTRGEEWTRTRRPFHFRADPDWAIPALQAAEIDWVCLANNHLLDYETVALRDTIAALDGGGIAHAGAGSDKATARAPTVVSVGDLTVGLFALTDNTPEYAAQRDEPGVAWSDMALEGGEGPNRVAETLQTLFARKPDLVVASVHSGPNMVAQPADQYVRFGHWLVDQGVDLVHGHSAHNVQGVERYGEGLLLHDCGDFVDDYAVDQRLRNDRGFLFELTVAATGNIEQLRLRPIEIEACAVHQASSEAAAWAREHMRKRSQPFGTSGGFERVGEGLALSV